MTRRLALTLAWFTLIAAPIAGIAVIAMLAYHFAK